MEQIYLDRDWQFNEIFDESMITSEMSEKNQVTIPHTVKVTPFHYFDETDYQMISCYQRQLFIEESYRGQKLFLTFEAVAHESDVYINGKHLCQHRCGYTAFTIDITEDVLYGENNLLTVKVNSKESVNQPPFGFVIDYMTYGGIYRNVYLEVKNPVYCSDVFYKPTFTIAPNTSAISRKQLLEMQLPGEVVTEMLLSEEAKKLAQERKLEIRQLLDDKEISRQPMDISGITKTLAGNVFLWDIENPVVYQMKTELLVDDEVVDSYETLIGFREAVFKKDGFYLNGRKVKIRGLNRHQSYAYVGYAMPESMQRLDASILKKELGLNAVRTSHYPQSQSFMEECDRLGLLVFTEMPGWQHIGEADWKDVAVSNVEEMVLQYRNHPSIILWGVRINESPDDDEFYQRTNDTAHRLDPTRQTGGVRCNKKMNLLEDVYTYNDFVHSGKNEGCESKDKVTPDMNKPYLISEYNGHMFPTKTFDCEEHVLEHTMRHVRVLDAVAEQEDIAGSFGWCMFDYNTHKDFGSGDRICYHGVMDMFRNPKMAAHVYAAQSMKGNVLAVTSSMDIGEHPASVRGDTYIITNADSVKMYKNDVLIKEYFPVNTSFPHMKRGPIAIDDLIGDEMMEKEGFSKKKNELVKTCLNNTAIHGYAITPKIAKAAARLMAFHHMNMNDATSLFQKYIGDWGGESKQYRFDAIRKGKVVASVVKAPMTQLSIQTKVSATHLVEDYTYDVAEIRVSICDEYQNVLPFFSENLNIETSGPIEVIGPKESIPFRGGMTGLYIKTVGSEGSAKVILSVEGAQKVEVEFSVTRK